MLELSLPYLFKMWVEHQPKSTWDTGHNEALLRTPFHSIPAWLFDTRIADTCRSTRHLVCTKVRSIVVAGVYLFHVRSFS